MRLLRHTPKAEEDGLDVMEPVEHLTKIGLSRLRRIDIAEAYTKKECSKLLLKN